jgi:chromosome segregation ATPase
LLLSHLVELGKPHVVSRTVARSFSGKAAGWPDATVFAAPGVANTAATEARNALKQKGRELTSHIDKLADAMAALHVAKVALNDKIEALLEEIKALEGRLSSARGARVRDESLCKSWQRQIQTCEAADEGNRGQMFSNRELSMQNKEHIFRLDGERVRSDGQLKSLDEGVKTHE